MSVSNIIRVKTITEGHRLQDLPAPEHPLISVVDCALLKKSADFRSVICDFYTITLKRGCEKLLYGQQEYDFDEGVMAFMAPNQVVRGQGHISDTPMSGWMLSVHPDFLWNTPLANKIKQYEYFGYAVHEALFLSEKEEMIINHIVETIRQEYHAHIDRYSQAIIIAHLETLFTYAERFYQRQFITRQKSSHHLMSRLEEVLAACFSDENLARNGLPTVQYISATLNVSPGYLSNMLNVLTGQSTQQHIHDKLIEKAKEKLSTTTTSVSEIAYALGFEHPQSFSKLFKLKTQVSPLTFRQSFQ
ncbi:MAG: helix-turn-helix transcriptional regulator [Bacteroidia bacterium]|nr:helix-turn-helix transcriptional regulator [Bacteroidia bacterium]